MVIVLYHCRSLYKQLVEEAPSEKFDERRVNLLKSQVIQLERQVMGFITIHPRCLWTKFFFQPASHIISFIPWFQKYCSCDNFFVAHALAKVELADWRNLQPRLVMWVSITTGQTYFPRKSPG